MGENRPRGRFFLLAARVRAFLVAVVLGTSKRRVRSVAPGRGDPMRALLTRRSTTALALLTAVFLAVSLALATESPAAHAVNGSGHLASVGEAGDESGELMTALSAYGDPRLSPTAT